MREADHPGYRLISAERASFPVSLQCELLGASRSGFYDWATRMPSDRDLADAWLVEKIKEIHERARGVYGARRIHAELRPPMGSGSGASASSGSCARPGSRA